MQAEIYRSGVFSTALLRACNALVCQLLVDAPKTQMGWIRHFAMPVAAWWPPGWQIPDTYDSSFALLDGPLLSEEASVYLNELMKQIEQADINDGVLVALAIENLHFKRLIDQLRVRSENANQDQVAQFQGEYVQLRKFLIEHPFTTSEAISRTFMNNQVVLPKVVGGFYDDCPIGQVNLVCKRCGPLRHKDNEWRGLRPSVCEQHDTETIIAQRDARQLKLSLQWRVCLPGLPEIRLFNDLLQLKDQYPKRLLHLELWPSLDAYDIQLRFSDGNVWAVDVKDYRHPHQMAKKVERFKIANALPHQMSFYVVPTHRIERNRNYLSLVRDDAPVYTNIDVVDEHAFMDRVRAKLRQRAQSKSNKT
ncbi:restriction endonuclease-related protein [Spirosoma litoris]